MKLQSHLRRERFTGNGLFWLFVASYTLVHLNFERVFWLTDGWGIFGKYAAADDPAARLLVAERVYYTKATWMFLLVWLQCLRIRFETALAWSFLVYSTELLLFFPFRTYAALNLVLALAMVVERTARRT